MVDHRGAANDDGGRSSFKGRIGWSYGIMLDHLKHHVIQSIYTDVIPLVKELLTIH